MTHTLPLTRIEMFWAGLVLPSFAGSAHGFTIQAGEVDYLDGLARFMDKASDKARLGIRVAFLLAVTAPVWITGRFTAFSSLTPDERSQVMDRMSRHSFFFVRELCLLLKLIACMAIFRSPSARTRTGYDGMERERRAAEGLVALDLVPLRLRKGPPAPSLVESGDYPTGAVSAARTAGGAR